jgi:ketosteroid isomerase-like protein
LQKGDAVPEPTEVSLEQSVRRLLKLLDAVDIDGLSAMLTDDAQSVDEITRGWTRGRAAIDAYMAQLKDTISDVHSEMSDSQQTIWGDVGLVTFVLSQTYTLLGQQHTISAPTSILFRRQGNDWKIALIHTVPIAQQG